MARKILSASNAIREYTREQLAEIAYQLKEWRPEWNYEEIRRFLRQMLTVSV